MWFYKGLLNQKKIDGDYVVDFEANLRNKIRRDMPLEKLVDTFCGLCSEVQKDVMYLFETGIFQFTCDEEFYFSLVRQCDTVGDEYYQVHLDIIFPPSKANYNMSQTKWLNTADEMRNYIKNSDEYKLLADEPIYKVEVWADKT